MSDGAVATVAAAPAATTPGAAEDVSWLVVSLMYGAGLLVCAMMAGLQCAGVSSVEGTWIIFSPFGPTLLYALYRFRQQKTLAASGKKVD